MDWGIITKIIPPVILFATTVLKSGLPKKWYDGRTIRYRWLRRGLNTFAVLSAVATVLVILYQDQSESKRSDQLAQMDGKLDSLVRLYGPLGDIARSRFPDSTAPAAITTLAGELKDYMASTKQGILEATEQMLNREQHRPFNVAVRSELIQRLKTLNRLGDFPFTNVLVHCQEGNSNRLLYGADLAEAIQAAGFSVRIQSVFILGRHGIAPIKCEYRIGNDAAADRFMQALDPVLNCTFERYPQPDVEPSTIEVTVYGAPNYLPSGGIILK